MQSTQELVYVLTGYFIGNRARLTFMAQYLLALIKTRSVNGATLADAFIGRASSASVYRRIQRFFAECSVSDNHLGAIVLSLGRKHQYRGLVQDSSSVLTARYGRLVRYGSIF